VRARRHGSSTLLQPFFPSAGAGPGEGSQGRRRTHR
jgi:hypothetical protein